MPFLLSPLHPRITSRISAPMPRVAMVTTETTEVTTKKSGRAQTVANQAGQVAVKGPEEPVDLGFESPLTDLESEGDAEPPPPKKRRRKAKVAEPVVYDIPPVETKSCTFKGKGGSTHTREPQFTNICFLGRLGYVRSMRSIWLTSPIDCAPRLV